MKLDSWSARLLVRLGFWLYRLWARTLRLQVEDPGNVVALVRDRPLIFAIWHNRLLMLPRVFDPCFPTRPSYGLISASGDGDLIAMFIERSGYGTIRGSSSRKGVIALRQLVETLAAGEQRSGNSGRSARTRLSSQPGYRFPCPKKRGARRPDPHGILKLLAPEELGPVRGAAALCDSQSDLRSADPDGADRGCRPIRGASVSVCKMR